MITIITRILSFLLFIGVLYYAVDYIQPVNFWNQEAFFMVFGMVGGGLMYLYGVSLPFKIIGNAFAGVSSVTEFLKEKQEVCQSGVRLSAWVSVLVLVLGLVPVLMDWPNTINVMPHTIYITISATYALILMAVFEIARYSLTPPEGELFPKKPTLLPYIGRIAGLIVFAIILGVLFVKEGNKFAHTQSTIFILGLAFSSAIFVFGLPALWRFVGDVLLIGAGVESRKWHNVRIADYLLRIFPIVGVLGVLMGYVNISSTLALDESMTTKMSTNIITALYAILLSVFVAIAKRGFERSKAGAENDPEISSLYFPWIILTLNTALMVALALSK